MKVPVNIARARRTERRFLKLGSPQPVCVLCGESDPACLDAVQGHHPTGRQRDPDLKVIVCANDQRKQHARLADEGLTMEREADPREVERSRFLLIAQFLDSLAEAHRERNQFKMANRVERLADEYCREANKM